MLAYLKIIDNVIKECSEYRINHIASILVIVLPLVFVLLLWNTIFSEVSIVGNFTKVKIITYYILVVLIQDLVYAGVDYEIADDIREGALSYYLIKPLNYLFYSFSVKIGVTVPYFLISSIMIFMFVSIFLRIFYIQAAIENILVFIIAVSFSFILSFLITFTISLTAFWIEEISSIQVLFDVFVPISSGVILPLSLFPPELQNIFSILPFKYLLNFPIEIYLGNLTKYEIIFGFTIQLIWIIFIYFLALIIWRLGLKHYQAYGG